MSLNRVILIGRLTRDPELRTTNTGKNVVEFSIAVNKRFKPQDGQPDADFFRVKAWGQTADYVSNYLTKGRLVSVDGRLETRKFTDKDGNNREVVEVVAENVQGLDRPKDDAGGNASAGGGQSYGGGSSRPAATAAPSADEYDPFADE
jgi:single-strand DNA-binding protein